MYALRIVSILVSLEMGSSALLPISKFGMSFPFARIRQNSSQVRASMCVCVCLCEYNKQISGKDKQDKHIYEVFSYVRQLVPRFPLGHINVIVVQLIRRHIERNIHFLI